MGVVVERRLTGWNEVFNPIYETNNLSKSIKTNEVPNWPSCSASLDIEHPRSYGTNQFEEIGWSATNWSNPNRYWIPSHDPNNHPCPSPSTSFLTSYFILSSAKEKRTKTLSFASFRVLQNYPKKKFQFYQFQGWKKSRTTRRKLLWFRLFLYLFVGYAEGRFPAFPPSCSFSSRKLKR